MKRNMNDERLKYVFTVMINKIHYFSVMINIMHYKLLKSSSKYMWKALKYSI